jgi:hypothetical protein
MVLPARMAMVDKIKNVLVIVVSAISQRFHHYTRPYGGGNVANQKARMHFDEKNSSLTHSEIK